MQYAGKETEEANSVRKSLESVLKGLGYSLIELTVSRQKGSVQVRAVIYNGASIGTDDCTKVHRSITPRLDLAFPGTDLYIEVSSPGIERVIKCGAEFAHYKGKCVKCYRTDISDWTEGVLQSVDEEGIVLMIKEEAVRLQFNIIAKAKLGL
ncbi:MAG: ribosome assembly cofactor RimP [Treponema sp.]|nr:ribosome assembly cofactor RimP [Treponema sp.]